MPKLKGYKLPKRPKKGSGRRSGVSDALRIRGQNIQIWKHLTPKPKHIAELMKISADILQKRQGKPSSKGGRTKSLSEMLSLLKRQPKEGSVFGLLTSGLRPEATGRLVLRGQRRRK